jgi:ferric-dicitrate binding protein FerR (iron transport regulator)
MKIKMSRMFRILSDESDDKEKLGMLDQIKTKPELAKRTRLLSLLWHVEKKRLQPRDMDLMWSKMESRITKEEAESTREKRNDKSFPLPKLIFSPIRIRYAFMLFLIIVGSLYLLKDKINFSPSHISNPLDLHFVKVDYGQRLEIELDDGTIIVADAGSEIQYPKTFSNRRDIYLKGEAYFEVAKDPERPFYVHANHALVCVIGTKFNIRAWHENPKVTVSVNEGKITLSQANGELQKSVTLSKNEMSLITPKNMPTKPQPTNAQDHLGWMKNEIKFNNATVEEVLAQLQRWYNYDFVVQDSSIFKERLTVHILPTNVNDVLEVISLLTNTKIENESNRILLIRKE